VSGNLRQIKTEDEFDELLATATKPVLVDATAAWCAPCQRLTPILEDFAASTDAIEIVALDTDDPRSLAWRLGGGSIPRLFLFDRGVLQMQDAGLRDRAWLEDVVGSYASLGIIEPDGVVLPPRTPARRLSLPTPATGMANLMYVNGADSEVHYGITAPTTVDLPAGSITLLMVSAEVIDSGYLRELDPTSIDQLAVGGALTAEHMQELAVLTSLQSIRGSALDDQRMAELSQQLQAQGRGAELARLAAEESTLSVDDLAPLASLPWLHRLDIMGGPSLESLMPHVIGESWLAPGVAAARRAKGLPEHGSDKLWTESPVTVGCMLSRRDDGMLELALNLTVGDGWYAFPPGSEDGVPVSITITSPHEVVAPLAAGPDVARLEGKASLTAVLDGPDEVRLEVTVQVCDGTVCMAPTVTPLVVPVLRKA